MTKIAILLLSLGMSSVALAHEAQSQSEVNLPGVYASLNHLIAQDLSCKVAADCKAIPTGSRACGGPNGYVVASRNSAHSASITTLAQLTESLEATINVEKGFASICVIEEAPAVECSAASTCQAL